MNPLEKIIQALMEQRQPPPLIRGPINGTPPPQQPAPMPVPSTTGVRG